MKALLTFSGLRLLPYLVICCMLIGLVGPAFAIFPPPTPPPTPSGSSSDGSSPPPNPGDGSGHTSGGPPTSGTPEPGTLVLALTGSGAAALAYVRRRRVSS
jgi:hypothetical protein